MKNIFYVTVGFLSFGIGSIGVLLPVLPTTPFLLLSAVCFAQGSEKFEVWLRDTKIYQAYVADYLETKTIAKNRKWKIWLNILVLMSISIYFAPLLPVKVFLSLLTVGITLYLFFVIPSSTK
ncbi:YbaN family protein [Jeotgalibaca caeni]|uniref:YbaN family protein n=1 Tax=Jeotgalibaca caeni TaxID=3028623 RepID=UPI00237E99A6|nr:YbaN family protein [Jeotgalibaca caeni]MDE1548236.1 YbaN family protein [Jeotgalibaca caeni]